jgi:hypothetical protein
MTAPLHMAVGVLLSRCLPAWAAIPACLFYHAVMDYYPEFTGYFDKPKQKGTDFFVLCEICMGFALLIWFLYHPSWLTILCMYVSCTPDIAEAIYQGIFKSGWDRPLCFFHANKWQGFAMRPVQCGLLDTAIFSLILIGA